MADAEPDANAHARPAVTEGSTVEAIWEKHGRHVPLSLALSIGDALLDALATAQASHGSGRAGHRDIQPACLFLTSDGRLEVRDVAGPKSHDATEGDPTPSGAVAGTPAFMAPEQALAKADEVDGRTDVWAVGATLFALLAGETVHGGETLAQLLVNAATQKARPLASVAPEVPREVAAVIDKALAFDRSERWASAAEMRVALVRAGVEATGVPIAPLPVTDPVTGLLETTRTSGGRSSAAGGAVSTTNVGPGTPSMRTARALRANSRWALAALGGAAIALTMWASVTPRGPRSAPSAAATPSASASSAPAPGRTPATPAAAAAYEAAREAEREGNYVDAKRDLDAAVASDPAFAAAYLRLAIDGATQGGNHDAEARAAYRAAADHKDALGEVDAALLEAWEPRFRDTPDRAERTRRLGEVARRYPQDAAVQSTYALCLDADPKALDAELALDRALAADPHYAPAFALKIDRAWKRGDATLAQRLVDACLKASPSALPCLEQRQRAELEDGRCAEAKADATRLLSIDPSSEDARRSLAKAMLALGEPFEAVDAAMREASARSQGDEKRHLEELTTAVVMDLAQGDLAGADKGDAARVALLGSSPGRDVVDASLDQIRVVLEEGDAARARGLVKALRARLAAAGGAEHDISREGLLAFQSMHAGATSRDELHAEQQRLLGYEKDDEARGWKWDRYVVWNTVYAYGAEDERDGAEAMDALPAFGGVNEQVARVGTFTGDLGKVYALAGRYAEALPPLERRAHACTELDDVITYVHTWYWLGLAREKTGDVAGARDAYGQVLTRWGKARPRSITADEARARLAGLAAGK